MRRRTAAGLALACAALLALPDQAQAADDADAPRVVVAAKKKKKKKRFKVRRIRPRGGAKFVDPSTEIRVRFNRVPDLATVSNLTIRLRPLGGSTVPWVSALNPAKEKELVITPVTPMKPGVDYQLSVHFGLLSVEGTPLKKEKIAIFFTDPRFDEFQFLHPDQFTDLDSFMHEGRAAHSATLLGDGRVLLAGGMTDFVRVSTSADLFEPALDRFVAVNALLPEPRAFHADVAFAGGAMLVGGWTGVDASRTTDIFDPSLNVFLVGPDMSVPRDFVAAVELDDGRVLVVGGLRYTPDSALYNTSAEIYDASTSSFVETASRPLSGRAGHTMTVLDDGTVLITGGQPATGLPTSEIFDPRTEQFRTTDFPPIARRQLHSATKLSSGWVLAADGGDGRFEIYDPNEERWHPAGGAGFSRRTRATASLLPGDRVLVAGGFDLQGANQLILEGMDLFLPGSSSSGFGRVVRASTLFSVARAGHAATTLNDGRVLFTGGFGVSDDFSLFTAVVFSQTP